jgi:hypothetical protein
MGHIPFRETTLPVGQVGVSVSSTPDVSSLMNVWPDHVNMGLAAISKLFSPHNQHCIARAL